MSFNNHTTAFLLSRENFQRRRQDSPSLDNQVEDSPTNPVDNRFALPPVWVDARDACEVLFLSIQDSIHKLEEAHNHRLVVHIDDRAENLKDKEIEKLTQETTKKFRLAEAKLKEIGEIQTANSSNNDLNVRLNVQRNLATRFQSLSLLFRKTQKEYMVKLKVQRKQTSVPSFMLQDDEEDAGNSAFLLSQDELQIEENRRKEDSRRIKERDQEVAKIAQSIEELSVIFKELSHLVIEQGSILDRIDQNMDLVVERTEKGVGQLEGAQKAKASNRANYCVGALVVVIFILFLIIMMRLG